MSDPEPINSSLARLAKRFKAAGPPGPALPPPMVVGPAEAKAIAEDIRGRALRAALGAAWRELVPTEFQGAKLDQLTDDGRPGAQRWAEGGWADGVNLVVTGVVGAGKTHLAFAAARVPFAAGETLQFWPVVELGKALDWHRDDHLRTFDSAGAVGVLILDDLGVADDSDWMLSQLYGIINRRWLDNLPTIGTTNLPPKELEARLGERTYSRLAGSAIGVRLTGGDRRRAQS